MTEAGATNALIRTFGAQKVMYGSDWPVAEGRGKCISLGDSFIWLTPDNIDLFARCAQPNIPKRPEVEGNLATFGQSFGHIEAKRRHRRRTAPGRLAGRLLL